MRTLLLLFLALIPFTSFAQNTTITAYCPISVSSTDPTMLALAQDNAVFIYGSLGEAPQLWTIDETKAPVQVTKDSTNFFYGAKTKATLFQTAMPQAMGIISNKVYFEGYIDSGRTASGLYEYDIQNKTLNFIYQASNIITYSAYNNELYFVSISQVSTLLTGLYKYTPSTRQTTLLLNDEEISRDRDIVCLNGKVYYTAARYGLGFKRLNEYDINTKTVTEIASDTLNNINNIEGICAGYGRLFFTGVDKTANKAGSYMYTSASGIQKISDTAYKCYDYNFRPLEHMGTLYFQGMYTYDTLNKKFDRPTIYIGNSTSTTADPQGHIAMYNGNIFFKALSLGETELYKYDLTTKKGTKINIKPGSKSSFPLSLTPFKSVLFFLGEHQQGIDKRVQLIKYEEPIVSTYSIPSTTIEVRPYPNPTTGNATLALQLNTSQTITVMLTDIAGRTIHTIPATPYGIGAHNIVLPLAQQPSGTYFYSIIDNSGAILLSGKLIKN